MNSTAHPSVVVQKATPADPKVKRVLERHFQLMRSSSPAESCHVMEPDALLEAGATLLAAQVGDEVMGVGALTEIEPGHGELKSMHTLAEARGQGVARVILRSLLTEAKSKGMTRVSLETGSADQFKAARGLYASEGFSDCSPFGTYVVDPLSVFMTREL